MRLLLLFIKIVDRLLEFVGIPGTENDFIKITVNRTPSKNIFEGYRSCYYDTPNFKKIIMKIRFGGN